MKSISFFILIFSLATFASAEFSSWTNKAGKSVELDLVGITQIDGQAQGEFKMRNGRTALLKVSDLSEADGKRLAEWKPSDAAAGAGTASVFDKSLEGNLVALKGKGLSSLKEFSKPSKYYLFYYTASWCGPCQKFTPSLVDFYHAKKPGSSEFEIILVTSDSDEDAMEGYAVDKKMIWPHLELNRVERFKKEFKHPGTGIPNLVLTDTDGKLLKTSYENGQYLGPAVVMNHLDSLLKK